MAAKRPTIVIFENVTNMDQGSGWKQTDKEKFIAFLESLEYIVHSRVYNPHNMAYRIGGIASTLWL